MKKFELELCLTYYGGEKEEKDEAVKCYWRVREYLDNGCYRIYEDSMPEERCRYSTDSKQS